MSAPRGAPILDRIFASVDMPDGPFDCWNWRLRLDRAGYGRIALASRPHLAHRVAFEAIVGPIPDGLTLDHVCRNRACVNPMHLEPVTVGENVRRGISPTAINARKTTCIHGHPLIRRGNRRFCHQCEAAATSRYKTRRKAA